MEQTINTCHVHNYVQITKLKFHPKNRDLRTITRDRLDDLKNSIVTKGFYEPILVWKKGGYILAGEHRTRAALELIEEGFTFMTPSGKKNHLPVVVEDVSESTAMQILHESNNHYASWIDDRLAKALKEAEDAGEDLRQYGYSTAEVDRLLESAIGDIEKVLEEAEDVQEPDSGEVTTDIKEAAPVQFKSLTLPEETHDRLMAILEQIALKIDQRWEPGQPLVDSVNALCDVIEESDLLGEKQSPEPEVVEKPSQEPKTAQKEPAKKKKVRAKKPKPMTEKVVRAKKKKSKSKKKAKK